MSKGLKYLAAIAIFCFFPTGLAGVLVYHKSEARALMLFRISIYMFLAITTVAGIYVVLQGGNLIKILGSFF